MKYKSSNAKIIRRKINKSNLHVKPALVTSYNIRPGNGVGLFSSEKIKDKETKTIKMK